MRRTLAENGIFLLRISVSLLMLSHGIPKAMEYETLIQAFPDPLGLRGSRVHRAGLAVLRLVVQQAALAKSGASFAKAASSRAGRTAVKQRRTHFA